MSHVGEEPDFTVSEEAMTSTVIPLDSVTEWPADVMVSDNVSNIRIAGEAVNSEDEPNNESFQQEYYDYIPTEPLLFPGFIPVSFVCLRQSNLLRRTCLQLMLSKYPFSCDREKATLTNRFSRI